MRAGGYFHRIAIWRQAWTPWIVDRVGDLDVFDSPCRQYLGSSHRREGSGRKPLRVMGVGALVLIVAIFVIGLGKP